MPEYEEIDVEQFDNEFLAEMLLRDLGCTDEDLEGMLEEWEDDDAENNT